MRRILAEHTVSITELRKNPAQYFTDEPVVVLSKNKPVGYMVNDKLFEAMVDQLKKLHTSDLVAAHLRPAVEQLRVIAQQSKAE
ncbi:type I toxin-antitoxin system antitoxin YafN [uncultured Tolumonas sp.]|uniref:type I toxin-antitoxin system antitoxin YafN n=1 Tax=uncultured Tolumonas sp. TaxID=263765 RepID=UPI00293108F7|nr:type I toxin-antitoxin system antitoxin YafN [uncultured Tolumonas sp.]